MLKLVGVIGVEIGINDMYIARGGGLKLGEGGV